MRDRHCNTLVKPSTKNLSSNTVKNLPKQQKLDPFRLY